MRWPVQAPSPGSAVVASPFENAVGGGSKTWVADPLGKLPAVLRCAVAQGEQRAEVVYTQDRVMVGMTRYALGSFYVGDGVKGEKFIADPDWQTEFQGHMDEQYHVVGSPLWQICARPSTGNFITSIRNDLSKPWPTTSESFDQLLPIVLGKRYYVAFKIVGGQSVSVWMHDQPFDPRVISPQVVRTLINWNPQGYTYGPQGYNYRGHLSAATAVVYGTPYMGWSSDIATALSDAGWDISVTPPPPPPPPPPVIDVVGATAQCTVAINELHKTDVWKKRHSTNYPSTHTGKAEAAIRTAIDDMNLRNDVAGAISQLHVAINELHQTDVYIQRHLTDYANTHTGLAEAACVIALRDLNSM